MFIRKEAIVIIKNFRVFNGKTYSLKGIYLKESSAKAEASLYRKHGVSVKITPFKNQRQDKKIGKVYTKYALWVRI